MLDFVASITNPFEFPERNCDIVIFKNTIPYVKETEREHYLELLVRHARDLRCFLVSQLYQKDEFLCLCILDRTGKIIGEQKCRSLSDEYRENFKKSTEMWIYDINFAKVYLSADDDITSVKTLSGCKNCDLIVSSQYINKNIFDVDSHIIQTAWKAAQLTCKFVAHTTNVASSIIAPCSMIRNRSFDGFLAGPEYKKNISSELYSRWLKYAKDTSQFKFKKSQYTGEYYNEE